ncbi:hypothetical protein DPMN_132356 [Dreissena polymorpha]|uniref:Uncharacterized protein n=1 Tax=Dreissena polymorpha TaxID=45954 RepID=A0A9D4FY63_DREPO|nr:hypothetical protein DPMN_132356 [Dreissena polymorpha]
MSFDSASSLLDSPDPQQLLDLRSRNGLTEEEANVSETDDFTVLSTIDALFLPPITTERPVGQSKHEICASQNLLTNAGVLLQKRLKLETKLSKSGMS